MVLILLQVQVLMLLKKGFPDAATQANPEGTTPANTDEAGQPEESNDSSGTINWENI